MNLGLISMLSDRLIGALAGPVADAVGDAVERKLGGVKDAGRVALAIESAVELAFKAHDATILARLDGYRDQARVAGGQLAAADALALHAEALVGTFNRQTPKISDTKATYTFGPDGLGYLRKVETLAAEYAAAREANP